MTSKHISSTTNPLVKELVRLRSRSHRERTGRFLIEGRRELQRALTAGVTITTVAVCPDLADDARMSLARSVGRADLVEMSEAPFRKVSYRQHPDGVLGVGASWTPTLDTIELGRRPLVLIAVGIEKPGNLGAIVRAADGAGADAVISVDGETDLTNPNVIRSSQGAVFSVPTAHATGAETLAWCRSHRLDLVAGTDDADRTFWEERFPDRLALVVGSEAKGLDATWKAETRPVRIPMAGTADSLNVATAAALLLYESVRQRTHPDVAD